MDELQHAKHDKGKPSQEDYMESLPGQGTRPAQAQKNKVNGFCILPLLSKCWWLCTPSKRLTLRGMLNFYLIQTPALYL